MTQETLELANELLSQIRKTTNQLQIAQEVYNADELSCNGFSLEIRSDFKGSSKSIFTNDRLIYRDVYQALIINLTSKLEQLTAQFEAL